MLNNLAVEAVRDRGCTMTRRIVSIKWNIPRVKEHETAVLQCMLVFNDNLYNLKLLSKFYCFFFRILKKVIDWFFFI